jgi:hypothetical protein
MNGPMAVQTKRKWHQVGALFFEELPPVRFPARAVR